MSSNQRGSAWSQSRLTRPEQIAEPEDAALVARALQGDPAGFRGLYDRHRPWVHRLARGFFDLDPDEVQDVIQEAFVRAFQNLASLKEPARFGPWLLAIARNRSLSRLARRRAQTVLADELGREAEATSTDTAAAPDPGIEAELEVVRSAIRELPEGAEKETVRLFYLDGTLSTREIAEKLGVGKSAITMRLERFRAKVKRRLLAEVARLRGEES